MGDLNARLTALRAAARRAAQANHLRNKRAHERKKRRAERLVRNPPPADLSGEQWRTAAGYPDYQVSDLGRVRSHRPRNQFAYAPPAPRLLRPYLRDGQYIVGLRDEKSRPVRVPVAQLVLAAFEVPRPPGGIHRYRDGDIVNVRLTNLYWEARPRVSHAHVIAELARGVPASELARRLGVHHGTITRHAREGRAQGAPVPLRTWRPPLSADTRTRIVAHLRDGLSTYDAARREGVSRASVARIALRLRKRAPERAREAG